MVAFHARPALLRSIPSTPRRSPVALYAAAPGRSNSNSVPAPASLRTFNWPPMRRARSRMPVNPQCLARPRIDALPVVANAQPQFTRTIRDCRLDSIGLRVLEQVAQPFPRNAVDIVAYERMQVARGALHRHPKHHRARLAVSATIEFFGQRRDLRQSC